MILLDTDHLTILGKRESDRRTRLFDRLAESNDDDVGTTIVNLEEQMRGWLAYIAQLRAVDRQVAGYHRLERMLEFYCATPLLPFDARAVEQFQRL